jgi:para-aminobenzoate synthetase
VSGIRTLIIDNYDSFTFNLYQLIGQVNGEEPVVVRNNQFEWSEIVGLAFDNIVISPGPGTPERPEDFGICKDAILKAETPVLGVCLGHQGLGFCFGGEVRHAPQPMHGRMSGIRHDGSRLFAGVPQDFQVVRYHSLMVAGKLPECLRHTAWTSDNILMGLAHHELPRFGIQFHPESICSEYGDLILKNFRDLTPRGPRVAYAAKARQTTVVPHPSPRRRPPLPGRVHSRKIPFDCANTSRAFATLYGQENYSFWLDSSRAEAGLSRFSFMGGVGGPLSALATYDHKTSEVSVIRSGYRQTFREDIFDYLTEELARRRCISEELPFDFNCGFVGYFGYELKAQTGATDKHPSPHPDASFLFADRMIAFDHQESEALILSYGSAEDAQNWLDNTAKSLANLPPEQEPEPAAETGLEIRLERNREQYLADVARCQEFIRDGESYEICLTNQIKASAIADPLSFYRRLRGINPAPYAAFLRFGDLRILSCSPERFLRIDRGGVVESKPIKGTRPRGETPEQDALLRRDLAENEKDRSENLMIVDLLRNDIGLISEMGSVKVTKLMNVETYQTVHQLVSTVRGWVRPEISAAGCVRAAFPGGSMTGAPKLRTMNLIDDLETSARGIYSGAIGFLSLGGTADLNIVIRTLVSTPEETSLGVGGAVIALSDPAEEFEETLVKARAMIQGLILNARGAADRATVDHVLADLRQKGYASL